MYNISPFYFILFYFILFIYLFFFQLFSYAENSDSEFSFEREVFVKTYSRRDSVSRGKFELPVKEDGAELTEYERRRQRNIEERERLFR